MNVTPLSQMPDDEVHGKIVSRAGTFSIIYANHIDIQIIKESRDDITLPDLAEIPDHPKYGAAIGTSLYGVLIYADQFILSAVTNNHIGGEECCGSGGGCNPVYEICG